MAAAQDFLISVLTGPNAGAVMPLAAGRASVGSGDDDLMLLDGVQAAALSLTLSGETVRLEAPVATLHDGATLPTKTRLPVTLRLNDETLINISRATPMPDGRVAPAMVALAGLLAFGLGLLGGAMVPSTNPAMAEAPAQEALPRLVEAPPPQTRVACAADCLTEAATALRGALDLAGMSEVEVATGKGILKVTGTIAETDRARWRDLRAAAEARMGGLPMIVELATGNPKPVLTVTSVWLGPKPELRSGAGETLGVGDRTADGWTVQAIEAGQVTLQRGERVVPVSF